MSILFLIILSEFSYTDSTVSSVLIWLFVFILLLWVTFIWTCDRADWIRWYFHHDSVKFIVFDFFINFNSEFIFFNSFFQRLMMNFAEFSLFDSVLTFLLFSALLSLYAHFLCCLLIDEDSLSLFLNACLCFFDVFF